MATNRFSKIQILNSSATGATPDVGVLDYGELAINYIDNKLYFKGEDNALEYFNVGGQIYYTASAPSGPALGDIWFHSDDGVFSLYVNDGDSNQWVEMAGKQGNTGPTGPAGEGSGGGGLSGSLSYNGLIEYPTNKTYNLDRFTVEDRTFNFLYVDCVTGGWSADFYAAGSTIAETMTVSPSGASFDFGTVVPSGSTFAVVVTGITGGVLTQDFGFVAGYTQ